MLGQPFTFVQTNSLLLSYFLIVLFLHKGPSKLVNFISKFQFAFEFLDDIGRVMAMFFAVDRVRDTAALQNSLGMMIIAGVLSGCGGGLIASAFNLTASEWKFSTPSGLQKPTATIKGCICVTLTYILITLNNTYLTNSLYLTTIVRKGLMLDRETARFLIGMIYVIVRMWKHCKICSKKDVMQMLASPRKAVESISASAKKIGSARKSSPEKKIASPEKSPKKKAASPAATRRVKKVEKAERSVDESPKPRGRRPKKTE